MHWEGGNLTKNQKQIQMELKAMERAEMPDQNLRSGHSIAPSSK
jgi:hypothetical protein